MQHAIDELQKLLHSEKDAKKKDELQRAIDSLKRQQNVTPTTERPDFRDPGFKQVANEPESGEELGEAIARTNKASQEGTSGLAVPDDKTKAQPPVEAGNINVEQEKDGTKTVTVKGGGQPSKPADVPAHSDKK